MTTQEDSVTLFVSCVIMLAILSVLAIGTLGKALEAGSARSVMEQVRNTLIKHCADLLSLKT